jgi:hypothetical protein
MSLSDSPPPLPKLPFILSDVALLVVAWFLARHQSDGPLTPPIAIAVTACVILGAVLAIIPFLVDYARRQDDALDERQRSLEALAQSIATSGEQIGIAANGFGEVNELAHKNLKQAEQLPHRLQEKIAEFNALLDHAREDDREELEKEIAELRASETDRLQAAADKVHKAVVQLTQLEASLQKQLATAIAAIEESATSAGRRIAEAQTAARAAERPGSAVATPPTDESQPASAVVASAPLEAQPAPTPRPAPSENEPAAAVAVASSANVPPAASPETTPADPTPPPAHPKPAAKKRIAKKPAPATAQEDLLLGLATDDESQASPHDPSAADAEIVERVLSSDGATRLLVTAYIGIGNRLFIRGDGPGLSWEKGLPLEFVSIGKWRWETEAATATVSFKLYKNDNVECTALGTLTLDPGYQQEVAARFS